MYNVVKYLQNSNPSCETLHNQILNSAKVYMSARYIHVQVNYIQINILLLKVQQWGCDVYYCNQLRVCTCMLPRTLLQYKICILSQKFYSCSLPLIVNATCSFIYLLYCTVAQSASIWYIWGKLCDIFCLNNIHHSSTYTSDRCRLHVCISSIHISLLLGLFCASFFLKFSKLVNSFIQSSESN